MPAPVAAFTFIDNLARTVQFQDGSSGSPTSWQWDFGDTQQSTDQNPSHTYGADGVYTITLTATNADGSNTRSYQVVVQDGEMVLPSILEMIRADLPPSMTIDEQTYNFAIKNWLIQLQSIDGVADEDVFKETEYRAITRILVARLVVYEKLVSSAQTSLLTMGSSGKGGLKSIEVGPAKTEWYDETESWKQAIQNGGQISLLTGSICGLAARVGIQLPFCPIPKSTHPPIVFYPSRRYIN